MTAMFSVQILTLIEKILTSLLLVFYNYYIYYYIIITHSSFFFFFILKHNLFFVEKILLRRYAKLDFIGIILSEIGHQMSKKGIRPTVDFPKSRSYKLLLRHYSESIMESAVVQTRLGEEQISEQYKETYC